MSEGNPQAHFCPQKLCLLRRSKALSEALKGFGTKMIMLENWEKTPKKLITQSQLSHASRWTITTPDDKATLERTALNRNLSLNRSFSTQRQNFSVRTLTKSRRWSFSPLDVAWNKNITATHAVLLFVFRSSCHGVIVALRSGLHGKRNRRK